MFKPYSRVELEACEEGFRLVVWHLEDGLELVCFAAVSDEKWKLFDLAESFGYSLLPLDAMVSLV